MAPTTIRRSAISTEVPNPYRDLFDSEDQTTPPGVNPIHCCPKATAVTVSPTLAAIRRASSLVSSLADERGKRMRSVSREGRFITGRSTFWNEALNDPDNATSKDKKPQRRNEYYHGGMRALHPGLSLRRTDGAFQFWGFLRTIGWRTA
jgi:hypothetical protein